MSDREAAMEHTEYVLAIINRELTTERDRLRKALEIIAGDSPCIDNLMSNEAIARAALQEAKHE